MLLIPSRFNFLLDDDQIAFNSSTCALVHFNLSFQKILQNPNAELSVQDNLLRDQMLSCAFLVPTVLDEISALRSRYLQSQANCDSLAVTIMPTDSCNFKCFYCFQEKKSILMSNDTTNALVNFIDSKLYGVKKLKVTWFGGEPLLALNLIQSLSHSLRQLAKKHSCDYDTFIISNGYLLNDSYILVHFIDHYPWRCTLTKVESRLTSPKTTSLVSSANIFSKTPFCCKRQKYL